MVQVWVNQKRSKKGKGAGEVQSEEEGGKEKEWKVLKEVEIDLGRVKRWNGKVSFVAFLVSPSRLSTCFVSLEN